MTDNLTWQQLHSMIMEMRNKLETQQSVTRTVSRINYATLMSIVTRLNCYEKDINELKMENDKLLGEIDMLREDKMTEKTFTPKEINKKIAEYFKQYMKLYVNDKMSFAEFSLIKSTLTDIQLLFSEDSE